MSHRLVILGIAVFVFGAVSTVHAQKAAEVYIPIGQSPGLSGKRTAIGTIDSLDAVRGTMIVADSSQSYLVRFTDDTKIYLDRSPSRQSNTLGKISDCTKYAVVEVKFKGNKVGDVAEWIKVRIDKE